MWPQATCVSNRIHFLTVDGQGRLQDLDELRQILQREAGVGLVSLAYVNNETGTILDIAAVGTRTFLRGGMEVRR